MQMRSLISGVLSAALICTTVPVNAEMVGTSQMLAQEARAAQLAQVQAFIVRDEVRSRMEALGVDPALAAERTAALTDGELRQLAQNIQDLPAGGDAVGVVLVVLLILILLEIVGVINIFSKI